MKAIIESLDYQAKQMVIEYIDPNNIENIRLCLDFNYDDTEELILEKIKAYYPILGFKRIHDAQQYLNNNDTTPLTSLIGQTIEFEVPSGFSDAVV